MPEFSDGKLTVTYNSGQLIVLNISLRYILYYFDELDMDIRHGFFSNRNGVAVHEGFFKIGCVFLNVV